MKSHTLPLMILALAAGGLQAQDGNPPLDRRPPPILLLKALDGDKDGALSADEIANSSAALLELDKNEDGKLSPREISPPPKGKKTKNPPPKGSPVIVKALDLDKDRFLSADEIEAAPGSLAALDKNGDGAITKDELKPGKPPVDPAT
jgi:hypothetical protein